MRPAIEHANPSSHRLSFSCLRALHDGFYWHTGRVSYQQSTSLVFRIPARRQWLGYRHISLQEFNWLLASRVAFKLMKKNHTFFRCPIVGPPPFLGRVRSRTKSALTSGSGAQLVPIPRLPNVTVWHCT